MRVLIIDDHILFREGLACLLRLEPDMEVVGECGSVAEAIETAQQLAPDVILMDFSLPDGTGVQATKSILAMLPDTQIIFLTVHDNDEQLLAAVRAGAKGYLLKNLSVVNLLVSLRGLERGEAAISRTMMARLLEAFSKPPNNDNTPAPSPLISLSLREIGVLKELAENITNQEIANRLYISDNTVKNHIHNILFKLNLKNRREAIDFARANGLSPSIER